VESGLKLRLRDHGITTDDLPRLARDAMLGERMLNNPCAITESDALRLYEAAW
jgi:alcohol dehydrogenase class IV